MNSSRSDFAPRGLNTETLYRAAERVLRMKPQDVESAANALFEAGAISYPYTEARTIWDARRSDAEETLNAISSLSPALAEKVKLADSEFKSAIWVADKNATDQSAIYPLPAAGKVKMTGDAARVFGFIAERYISQFDPRQTPAANAENTERRSFSVPGPGGRPHRIVKPFGKPIDFFGPTFFVQEDLLHLRVLDGVDNDALLVIPASEFAEYLATYPFASLDEFVRLNPKLMEAFVEAANGIVLPHGRGLWVCAEDTYKIVGRQRYYRWPSERSRI